jgi:hypothetical protein
MSLLWLSSSIFLIQGMKAFTEVGCLSVYSHANLSSNLSADHPEVAKEKTMAALKRIIKIDLQNSFLILLPPVSDDFR